MRPAAELLGLRGSDVSGHFSERLDVRALVPTITTTEHVRTWLPGVSGRGFDREHDCPRPPVHRCHILIDRQQC
eukprot:670720-Hanusia_phi.AAC.1